ncbi:MAG: hypothetical protein U0Z17_09780 [Bacteroidales bacterium]
MLFNGIEWDWYTRGGQNVLYWHWSPNYGWDMNFKLRGYNETLITYIMAAASTAYNSRCSLPRGICPQWRDKERKNFLGMYCPWDTTMAARYFCALFRYLRRTKTFGHL